MHDPDSRDPAIARRSRRATAGLVAIAAAAAACAHAASFDCRRAARPMERAICASPRLSTLDEQMARTYERAVHALSAEGATQLKASQRDWLRFVTATCAGRKSGRQGKRPGDESTSCLERAFEQRADQVDQAGVRLGPYVFNRIDHYLAQATPTEESGEVDGFVIHHVGYPLIDAPKGTAAIAWNAARQKDVGSADVGPDAEVISDEDSDATLGCVGDRFISLLDSSSEFQHGSAHGTYDHEVDNTLLVPALRKMTVADIFTASSGWKARLPDLFWNAYAQQKDAIKDTPSVEEAIRQSAANADAWLLTPAGLQISFGADEAGCYACNPGPITLPWSQVRTMLATPDLAACKAPPTAHP